MGWILSVLLPQHERPLPSTVSFGSSDPRMSNPPHHPQESNFDKTRPEVVGPVRHQGQRTEQDKLVSTAHLPARSNDRRTRWPSCIVPSTPGYIGNTNAKTTTGSHHIVPISQGNVDSCSTLHGGNRTARELAPTLREGVFGTLHAETRGCLSSVVNVRVTDCATT